MVVGAGVVTAGVVVTGWVVGMGVTGGGIVVPVETVVAPMEKLMMFESGACMSKEAGSCHFAWTEKVPAPRSAKVIGPGLPGSSV